MHSLVQRLECGRMGKERGEGGREEEEDAHERFSFADEK